MTKKARSIPAAVLLALALSAGSADATYSIVARDPETGRLGVAVQSHWFQVGPVDPLGPTIATRRPCSIRSETSSSAG